MKRNVPETSEEDYAEVDNASNNSGHPFTTFVEPKSFLAIHQHFAQNAQMTRKPKLILTCKKITEMKANFAVSPSSPLRSSSLAVSASAPTPSTLSEPTAFLSLPNDIPREIWTHIFSFLPPKFTLSSVLLVCKYFYILSWESISHISFGENSSDATLISMCHQATSPIKFSTSIPMTLSSSLPPSVSASFSDGFPIERSLGFFTNGDLETESSTSTQSSLSISLPSTTSTIPSSALSSYSLPTTFSASSSSSSSSSFSSSFPSSFSSSASLFSFTSLSFSFSSLFEGYSLALLPSVLLLLRLLDLSCCSSFKTSNLKHLKYLKKLEILCCGENVFGGVVGRLGEFQAEVGGDGRSERKGVSDWKFSKRPKKSFTLNSNALRHLGRLTQLTQLNLDGCYIKSDASLENLTGLSRLKFLGISDTTVEHVPGILHSTLTAIVGLNVSFTEIEEHEIAKWCKNCPNMKYLEMVSVNSVPHNRNENSEKSEKLGILGIPQFGSLKYFAWDNSDVATVLPALEGGTFKNITHLCWSDYDPRTFPVRCFRLIPNLESLRLSALKFLRTELGMEDAAQFQHLTKLKRLQIEHLVLSRGATSILGDFSSKLDFLEISSLFLKDDDFIAFCVAYSISSACLPSPSSSSISPSPGLRSFIWDGNPINSSTFSFVEKLREISSLNLCVKNLKPDTLTHLSNLPHLKFLTLKIVDFPCDVFHPLVNIPTLESVELFFRKIRAPEIPSLGNVHFRVNVAPAWVEEC